MGAGCWVLWQLLLVPHIGGTTSPDIAEREREREREKRIMGGPARTNLEQLGPACPLLCPQQPWLSGVKAGVRRGWGGSTPPNSIHAAAWLWKRVLALALERDGEAATSVGERELWPVVEATPPGRSECASLPPLSLTALGCSAS